jgi:hypothetical protein
MYLLHVFSFVTTRSPLPMYDDLRRFLAISSTKHTHLHPAPEIVERSPETLSRVHPPNQPSIVVTKVSLKTFNHSTLFVSPTLSSKRVNIYEIALFRPIWPSNCARLVSNKYFFFAKPKYHPASAIGTRCTHRCILVKLGLFLKK